MSYTEAIAIIAGASGLIVAAVPIYIYARRVRRSATASVAKADNRIAEVMDSIDDLVYETDAKDRISFWNRGFTRIFKFDEGKDLGQVSILDLYVNPAHRQILMNEMASRGGSVSDYVVWVKRQDSEDFYLSIDSSWRGEDRSSGVRGTGRDVTQRIRMIGGFCQLNKAGRVTFCDHAFAYAFKFNSPNYLIGHDLTKVLRATPETWEWVRRRLVKRKTLEASFAATTHAGGIVYVTLTTHRVLDSQGRFRAIEASLKSVHTGGVYIIQNWRIAYADREFEHVTGYEKSQILGMPIDQLVVPEDFPLVRKETERKLAGGYGRVYEFRIRKRNGQEELVVADSAPTQFHGEAAVAGYIVSASDESLVKERLQQRHRLTEIGQAVGSMRHFLENKLTPILGFAQRLSAKVDDPEIPQEKRRALLELTRWIEINATQLSQAMDDLYNPGLERTADQPVTLRGILQDAIGSLQIPEAIRVQEDIDSGIPLIRRGARQLTRTFTYIVRNAAEAMPDGGTLGISAKYDTGRDQLTLQFHDTGVGIPEENISQVLRPFFTTKKSSPEGGTGLGLWYCVQVLDNLNATIYIESETEPPNNGTLVEIVFNRFRREASNGGK